jgi:hypothetical protein
MKKIFFVLPPLFFTLIFATCKKNPMPDNDYPYFQCKINGKTYIPNGCANCTKAMLLGDTTLLINGNAGFESVAIGIINATSQPIEAITYTLNDNPRSGADYKNSTVLTDIFNTDKNHTGQIKVIKLDKANKIIQGTFYFKAYNAYRNDSVSITEGKFLLNITN